MPWGRAHARIGTELANLNLSYITQHILYSSFSESRTLHSLTPPPPPVLIIRNSSPFVDRMVLPELLPLVSEEWRVLAEACCAPAQRYAQLARGSPPSRAPLSPRRDVCRLQQRAAASVTVPAGPVWARGRSSFYIQSWMFMHLLQSGRAGPVPAQLLDWVADQ